jgi:hypothetical protein
MIISDLICYFLERHKGIKKNNFRIRIGGFLTPVLRYFLLDDI